MESVILFVPDFICTRFYLYSLYIRNKSLELILYMLLKYPYNHAKFSKYEGNNTLIVSKQIKK